MSGIKQLSFDKATFFLIAITIGLCSAAESTLESPCLRKCPLKKLTPEILQNCINTCITQGHCGGNRLNGECISSSNEKLSCANGCEIAYYTSTVNQCKADCDEGNKPGCMYVHSNIENFFQKCGNCEEEMCNEQQPSLDACYDGCELAASFPNFYQYVEASQETCVQDDIPRFLFGGQSNMVRKGSESAMCNFG